jgi:hypothetical protein
MKLGDVEGMSLESFRPHLNTKFRVLCGPEQWVEVELVEASESAPPRPGIISKQERFSLVFSAPHDSPLWQGLYQFEHDALGEFALFIVPVGRGEQGVDFEAVFNRLPTR